MADQGSSGVPEEPSLSAERGVGQTSLAAAVARTVPTVGGLGVGIWQGSVRWFLLAATYYVVADPLRDFLLEVSHKLGPTVADAVSGWVKRRGTGV